MTNCDKILLENQKCVLHAKFNRQFTFLHFILYFDKHEFDLKFQVILNFFIIETIQCTQYNVCCYSSYDKIWKAIERSKI